MDLKEIGTLLASTPKERYFNTLTAKPRQI
jgi:hypothetical protein